MNVHLHLLLDDPRGEVCAERIQEVSRQRTQRRGAGGAGDAAFAPGGQPRTFSDVGFVIPRSRGNHVLSDITPACRGPGGRVDRRSLGVGGGVNRGREMNPPWRKPHTADCSTPHRGGP